MVLRQLLKAKHLSLLGTTLTKLPCRFELDEVMNETQMRQVAAIVARACKLPAEVTDALKPAPSATAVAPAPAPAPVPSAAGAAKRVN